ncbi:MAG: hypothetical protein JSS29_11035 [Proteobacteria bacterium]|nr:hypothetical protein [Pseudomonadota bacterium]
MKSLRIFTVDGPIRRRVHGDEILTPLPAVKTLVPGTLWTGNLAPELRDTLNRIEPMLAAAPGLDIHGTLDPVPPLMSEALAGRRWLGDLHTRIAAAAKDGGAAPADVDVTQVLRDVELLHRQLMTPPQNFAGPAKDTMRRLRKSLDALTPRAPIMNRPIGSFGAQKEARQINADNARFWRDRRGAGVPQFVGDSVSGPVRDALHKMHTAKTEGERLAAMNELNAAAWAGR